MTEYELAAEVYCFIKALGADDNFQLISASQHNLAVNPPSDRRLDVGDVILAEISPSYGDSSFKFVARRSLGRLPKCNLTNIKF